MASIFFPLGPAKTPGHCQSGRRAALKPASEVRQDRIKTTWRVVVEVPKPLRKLLDGKPRFIRSVGTD
jgi:hypothetical protein